MPAIPALITVVAGELITASDANYNWTLLRTALTSFNISNLSGSITAAQHGDLSVTTTKMHDDLSIKYSGSLVGVTTVHGALIGIISEIWGLSAAISGFSSSISALSGSVGSLSGSVGSLSGAVTAMSASISRIDALSGSLGQLITDVQILSAAVHAMSGSMGGFGLTYLGTASQSIPLYVASASVAHGFIALVSGYEVPTANSLTNVVVSGNPLAPGPTDTIALLPFASVDSTRTTVSRTTILNTAYCASLGVAFDPSTDYVIFYTVSTSATVVVFGF